MGGPGAETLSFTTTALANGLYQLTLIGTGSNAIRDIAGNTPGGNIVVTFAVFNPNNITGVFVGPASFITDPTSPRVTAPTRSRRSATPWPWRRWANGSRCCPASTPRM